MEAEYNQALERIEFRLIETVNDKLAGVLTKLLPKLIGLSNNEALRTKIVDIFNQLTPRMYFLVSNCSVV